MQAVALLSEGFLSNRSSKQGFQWMHVTHTVQQNGWLVTPFNQGEQSHKTPGFESYPLRTKRICRLNIVLQVMVHGGGVLCRHFWKDEYVLERIKKIWEWSHGPYNNRRLRTLVSIWFLCTQHVARTDNQASVTIKILSVLISTQLYHRLEQSSCPVASSFIFCFPSGNPASEFQTFP